MTIIQFPKNKESCCGSDRPEPITLTLPVAPRPFARIRFEPADQKVRAVPIQGALNWLEENKQQGAQVKGVDIAGPGDPLVGMEVTLETLRLVRERYPDMDLSITTLGIHADQHAESLAEAGVTAIRLKVDAVSRKVAEKLYAWIRPGTKTIPLSQALPMLLQEQLQAVKTFKEAGCTVTVRTTVYPGINDTHIEEIAEVMGKAGAEAMELVPCRKGAEDFNLAPLDPETLKQLQELALDYLPTEIAMETEHRIGTGCSSPHASCGSIAALTPKSTKARPNIALVSSNGMEIDLHLGQAYQVLIYGPREDGLACLLETRPAPEPGSDDRWEELAKSLYDCFAILVASAGERPRKILGDHGIQVLITDGEIECTVETLLGGGKNKCKKGKTM